MGTCQPNGVYVNCPVTFDCNKPQRSSITLFRFQSFVFGYLCNLKSLKKIVMIKIFLFHYVRNSKSLMKKSSNLLQSKLPNLTECKIQKASFENL